MSAIITIGRKPIGAGQPCYIIAEVSANHGQSYDQAVQIIQAAKEAGADAVKLQTYTPATITLKCDNRYFRAGPGTLWKGKNLFELYEEAHTPWDWQPKLKQAAEQIGLECFSTPFDATAVEFLETMEVKAHKIASFELVDLELIGRVARTRKPVIMSTGMATLGEIDEAVRAFRQAGGVQLALLKCNSAYPARPEEMNLRTIPHLADAFGVPVGLSDHTLGITAAIAAVALGACIIEKHLTISRSVPGPDSAFSLEPEEFGAMVQAVRATEAALGKVTYEPTKRELASRVFRRSLFVVEDMGAGQPFTQENLRSIRPSDGLAPKYLPVILGRHSAAAIARGTPLAWNLVA